MINISPNQNQLVSLILYVVILIVCGVATYLKMIPSDLLIAALWLVIGHGSATIPGTSATNANTAATQENTAAIVASGSPTTVPATIQAKSSNG